MLCRWRTSEPAPLANTSGKTPAAINRDLTTLKSMLSKAVTWGVIYAHPLTSLKPLKVEGTTAQLYAGTGTPESAVTAAVGSLFLRTDGGASTSLYVKESGSGNTGWVAK